jgi:head-tail adaptor
MSAVIQQAVAIGRQVAAQYRPDTYEVRRTVETDDGEGGSTPVTTTVESGGCVLTAGVIRPAEQAVASAAGATVAYTVRNLPYTTVLTAEDELRISGRTFQVLGVLRSEVTNVAVTAVCQERT